MYNFTLYLFINPAVFFNIVQKGGGGGGGVIPMSQLLPEGILVHGVQTKNSPL